MTVVHGVAIAMVGTALVVPPVSRVTAASTPLGGALPPLTASCRPNGQWG